MEEIKKILGNLWKAIIKLILSKTDLDEKLAEKVESLNEEMSIMEEVAEEVAFTVAMSGLDTISANPMDIKQMIKIKKEMKIIDMKIEKALAGDSSADIDDLIILKNMYNLNGVK